MKSDRTSNTKIDYFDFCSAQKRIFRYYVFYNGKQEAPEEEVLRLTDVMPGDTTSEISCAEFKAHMININAGYNTDLMKKCPLLFEYSKFVETIRENQDAGQDLKAANQRAEKAEKEKINMILRCRQKGMSEAEILELAGISKEEFREILKD